MAIAYFWITSGLFFEASLGAHLFISKTNFHSCENELNLRAYERMSTKTRFEKEAWGNSEMAYFNDHTLPRRWNRELTLKCKFKCYLNVRALALVKGNREPHEEKKKSFDLGGNRTHDLRIRSTVTLPTELQGRREKVGDDFRWWIAAKRK